MQICNAGADYCQDRIAEQLHRETLAGAPRLSEVRR